MRSSPPTLFLETHSRQTCGARKHGFGAIGDRKGHVFNSFRGGPLAKKHVSTITESTLQLVYVNVQKRK